MVHNKHRNKRDGSGTGGLGTGKTAVIGAVSRKGNVVARVIATTDTATMDRFVRETVCTKVSLIATDEHLPLYVAEFQFRYNNRQNADIFGAAVGQC